MNQQELAAGLEHLHLTDEIASIRAQIEQRGSKYLIKMSKRIKGVTPRTLEDLREILSECPVPKKVKKANDPEAEAKALRARRMDVLSKIVLTEDDICWKDLPREYDLPDINDNVAEQMAYSLLINTIKKVKVGATSAVDSHRPRDPEDINGKVSVNFGKGTKSYDNVITVTNTQKHGVVLPEDESVVFDMSDRSDTDSAQCIKKPCLRGTPVDKCVGCETAIVWDFQRNLFSKGAEGTYEKVNTYDFGLIPCNIKTPAGEDICVRHMKSKKSLEKWSEGDFKSCGLTVQ